ncbi:MAG: SpoIID/LytB domain-containing protein [Candidatus Magasanikbacteria bacterium]|nr:SpoIID/LytB domain-containing protein [Candidatus Magasanikbacteria bacterium]
MMFRKIAQKIWILAVTLIVAFFVVGQSAESKEPDYAAEQYSKIKEIEMRVGERQKIKIGFKNIGRYNWRSTGKNFVSVYTFGPKYRKSVFEDDSWIDADQSTKLKDTLVGPTQLGYFEFYLQAPDKVGVYAEKFALAAENKLWIPGGEFELVITVKDEVADSVLQEPSAIGEIVVTATVEEITLAAPKIIDGQEPTVRVGLFTTEEPIIFTSPYTYEIKNTQGELFCALNPNEEASVSYVETRGVYNINCSSTDFISASPMRVEPTEIISFLELKNYEKRLRWLPKVNNNKFRGVIEINFSKDRGYLWVINEIPFEYYIKGIAESADNRHSEFLKALAVAVRTYALNNLSNSVKHGGKGFDVDADIDQVYRGYAFEEQMPFWSNAIDATRGMVVTYKNEAVTTPYFARSSGRTRTWREAWGGANKPWIKSVKTPYDRGYSRLGHGVGMSLHDALARAKKGALYEEIIKYYYSGVEIKSVY